MKRIPHIALLLSLLASSPLALAVNHTGAVQETMNSGGYTYARVMENGKEFWIAGPAADVKVGDTISFGEQMWMPGFTSKTLDRTFEKLLFVGTIARGTTVSTTPPSSPHEKHSKPAISIPAAKTAPAPVIKKATGPAQSYTVAELFERRAELSGKAVKVQGEVVKVSNGIMKTNWVHLQDGSSTANANSIIFRSPTETAQVGDVLIAQGTLVTDQDFGYGYKYPVIVEHASFQTAN